MTRSSFVSVIGAGILAAALHAGCDDPAGRPNLILISIDCLNQRQLETAFAEGYAPALASLAESSTMFTRAYAHAPWTTPSHMSMLTGLYPSQHGRDIPYGLMIRWNEYNARVPDFETLGDRLGAEGYDTAAFVGQGSISGTYGLEQGFDTFVEHRKTREALTDLTESYPAASTWLGDTREAPFFLFFHTYDLHGPRPTGLDSDRDAIQYIDQYLGRLFLALKAEGLYESSLIIVTGDHGSNMIETDGKCCVHGAGHYDENLKVPLLVKRPHQTEAGIESGLARHVDLFPTVVDILGIATDYDGPGRSLLTPGENIVSFSEADGRCALRHAIVTERYKYIYTVSDERQALMQQDEFFFDETCKELCRDIPLEELYDLRKDPFENRNLLDGRLDPERQADLDALRRELTLHLNLPRRFNLSVVTEPHEQLDDEQKRELREALESLGYLR